MDAKQAGRYWDENADAWTALARHGYDVYRDRLNTPAFFEMLPDVAGLAGVDIGAGEGYNTRLLADRGAKVAALDVSPRFVGHASRFEDDEDRGIRYLVATATHLPFADSTFDFVTGFMSFMDIPDTEQVLGEAFRVLKPGGFLQFSITHPCFDTPYRRNLRDDTGRTYAIEIADYFRSLDGEVSEWIFAAAPPDVRKGLRKFQTPRFTRPISEWLNLLTRAGFQIERVEEPCPDDDAVAACPDLQDAQVVAYFLHVRARKPTIIAGEPDATAWGGGAAIT